MGETFTDLLSAEESAKMRIKGALEGRLTTVLFVMCLVCSSALSIVETGVVNPLAPELWVGLANRFLTSYVTYILFITPGERDELMRDKKHGAVAALLDELSEEVYHGGMLSRFYAFCTVKEQELLEKRKRRIYSRYLDSDRYAELEAFHEKRLRAEYKAGRLTKEQYTAVKQAKRQKPHAIRPAYILSACAVDKTEEAGISVMSYAKKSILTKPVTFVVMSLVLNSVTFTWADTTLFNAVIGIVTSAIIIFYSALSGYKVGRTSAAWETAQRQHRIRFLREFEEWKSIKKEA